MCCLHRTYEKIAGGDGWNIYAAEKDGLSCYFVYEGEKHPKSGIHTKLVLYAEEDGAVVEMQKEWFPDETSISSLESSRYYFSEEIRHVTGIGRHIRIWFES